MSDDMVTRASRIAVAIEAAVILAPLTLLATIGVFVAILFGALGSAELLLFGTAPMAGLLALFCGWYLAIRYVRSGQDSLASVPSSIWILPFSVGAASLAGLWVFLSGRLDQDCETDGVSAWLGLFAFGSPAVVPLLHLAAERWLRTNNLVESTA